MKSLLWETYRTIGEITSNIPISYKRVGKENFINTIIGKVWCTYDCKNQRLTFQSKPSKEKQKCQASMINITFTSYNNEIQVWKRIHEVLRLIPPEGDTIIYLLCIGKTLITQSKDNHMYIWDLTKIHEIFARMEIDDTIVDDNDIDDNNKLPQNIKPIQHIILKETKSSIVSIQHPQTYMNKILIVWEDGTMELWNIKNTKLIYKFTVELEIDRNNNDNTIEPKILCVECTSMLDIIAIGYTTGHIVLYNLKLDSIMCTFYQYKSPVKTLTYGIIENRPYIVSSLTDGQIAIWDIEEKKLQRKIRVQYDGNIIKLLFQIDEPQLIIQGDDNSQRIWIFDQPDISCRLLRQRDGHSKPPKKIIFFNDSLLQSTSDDCTLRGFNISRDISSYEFSQGNLQHKQRKNTNYDSNTIKDKRQSPIICISCEEKKESILPTILTCHKDDSAGWQWDTDKHILCDKKLYNKKNISISNAVYCTITSCGTYGLLGYDDGRLEKYNIESGLYRGTYGLKNTPHIDMKKLSILQREEIKNEQISKYTKKLKTTWTGNEGIEANKLKKIFGQYHQDTITGIFNDNINKYTITISLDHTIRIWDFNTLECLYIFGIGDAIICGCFSKENNQLIIGTQGQIIYIIDIILRRIVRKFTVPYYINTLQLTYDNRILTTAHSNGEVRSYDIITGCLIDWIQFTKPVTCIAYSPKSNIIATTHIEYNGIYLWINKQYYSHLSINTKIPTEPILIDIDNTTVNVLNKSSTPIEYNVLFKKFQDTVSLHPILDDTTKTLLTLSDISKNRQKQLQVLDNIRERSKPNNDELTKPSQDDIPFFLQLRMDSINKDDTTIVPLNTQSDDCDIVKQNKRQRTNSSNIIDSILNIPVLNELYLNICNNSSDIKTIQEPDKDQLLKVTELIESIPTLTIEKEIYEWNIGDTSDKIIPIQYCTLEYILHMLKIRHSYNFIQTFLRQIINIYGDIITSNSIQIYKITDIYTVQKKSWRYLEKYLHSSLSIQSFFINDVSV